MSNIVKAKVTIRGTRTLLQHRFGPESIPLEKQERTGVAGNDPIEWKKSCMVTPDGNLYLPGTYIFGCLKNGAVHTKKGKGSIQSLVVSTMQIEEDLLLLNRNLPSEKELTQQTILTPPDPEIKTFIYVSSVRNPSTKGRNVRYRLATRAGWKLSFTLVWDKTVVPREQMKAVLRDSGILGGLGDGIKIGCGRFEVVKYEELTDAQEETTEGSMGGYEGNGLEARRTKMRSLRETTTVG